MQRYEITSMIKQLWEQRISIHSIIKILNTNHMTINKLLGMLCICTIITSCSKDNDFNNEPEYPQIIPKPKNFNLNMGYIKGYENKIIVIFSQIRDTVYTCSIQEQKQEGEEKPFLPLVIDSVFIKNTKDERGRIISATKQTPKIKGEYNENFNIQEFNGKQQQENPNTILELNIGNINLHFEGTSAIKE